MATVPEKPDIISDIRQIQRYSRHNQAQDIQFRNYLKHDLRVSSKQLDAEVTEITNEVWGKIDCLKCGNCCRTLEVEVDDDDVRRLSRRMELPVPKFRSLHVRIGGDRKQLLAGPPCTFLGEDNKCSVYEDRPKSCRDFPYLNSPDVRSRSLTIVSNLGSCPIVFNVWQRMKDRFWRLQAKKRR